jgi:hypothetical protein
MPKETLSVASLIEHTSEDEKIAHVDMRNPKLFLAKNDKAHPYDPQLLSDNFMTL